MPKTKAAREQVAFKGFIEYDLTLEERASLKALPMDLVEANVQLENLVKEEYRASFGFDFYNNSFTCSLSQKDPSHVNAGWVLVGRGSDPIRALKQVLYKHHNIFDGLWSNARSMSRAELDD